MNKYKTYIELKDGSQLIINQNAEYKQRAIDRVYKYCKVNDINVEIRKQKTVEIKEIQNEITLEDINED